MAQRVTVFSSSFDSLKSRVIKFLRFGLNDTQTATEAVPFGMDSNPVKDMIAIYSETSTMGEAVIIGYINENQLADPGETRIFSTDSSGGLKTYIWLKADGKIQLGGTADNSVRWKPLDKFSDDLKQFLNIEMAKIAIGISAGGGSYSPGTPNFDVDDAKIDEIQTS